MFRQFLMLRLAAKDGERAFVMRNGRFERVLGPVRHRLFDPLRGLAVELHNVVRGQYPAERFAALKAARPDLAAEMFEPVETKADEVGIVALDKRPSFLMAPWQTCAFRKVVTTVGIERIHISGRRLALHASAAQCLDALLSRLARPKAAPA